MKLDPTQMKDWQIAEAAEETMQPIARIAEALGVLPEELIPYGNSYAKVDAPAILKRTGGKQHTGGKSGRRFHEHS